MDKIRLLNLKEIDAYDADLFEEAIPLAESRNILVLLRPPAGIRMGKKAKITQVDYELCKKKNLIIHRSFLSGGVAMCKKQLDYTLIIDKDFMTLSAVLNAIMNAVVNACKALGLSASIRADSNDVLVNGKKVSGQGMNSSEDSWIISGDMILDFDYALSKEVLKIDPKKFDDKSAKSVEEWITTLEKESGRKMSFEEVENAFIQGFKKSFGLELGEVSSWNAQEEQAIQSLQEKYRSEEWIKYGRYCPIKEYK